ncbi:hypothetical protein ABFS83_07G030500 [Erythranthe nasuta]
MVSSLTNLIFFFFLLPIFSAQNYNQHPLNPLTPLELTQIQTLIRTHFSNNVTFHYVGLDEPEKSAVLSWQSNPAGTLTRRRAFVISRSEKNTHETLVDLSENLIVSDKIYAGTGYPIQNSGEQLAAGKLAFSYAPFVDSIEKRGLKLEEVVPMSFTVGWFGEEGRSKRIVRVMCYYLDGTVNMYMRPIEGLTLTVDLDEMKIVGFRDRIVVPVPKPDGTDYRESDPSSGSSVLKERGPGFTLDGHVLRWADWVFHISFDMRAGLIISLASIYDHIKNQYRSVMYKGFLSELFVPYMDLTEEWYYRTFFDAGEYGFGFSAVPLVPSKDCPPNAVFMDGHFTSQDGTPRSIPNAFCIFERYAGDAMWRHTEWSVPGQTIMEVRPEVNLVVRMVATVGNYDYIVDWEFKQTGVIKVNVSVI